MKQVLAHHHAEHRGGEEADVGKKGGVARLVGHVLEREEVDEERDERYHEDHHRGEGVDEEAKGQARLAADGEPGAFGGEGETGRGGADEGEFLKA